jgi:hypothetical protein
VSLQLIPKRLELRVGAGDSLLEQRVLRLQRLQSLLEPGDLLLERSQLDQERIGQIASGLESRRLRLGGRPRRLTDLR